MQIFHRFYMDVLGFCQPHDTQFFQEPNCVIRGLAVMMITSYLLVPRSLLTENLQALKHLEN